MAHDLNFAHQGGAAGAEHKAQAADVDLDEYYSNLVLASAYSVAASGSAGPGGAVGAHDGPKAHAWT